MTSFSSPLLFEEDMMNDISQSSAYMDTPSPRSPDTPRRRSSLLHLRRLLYAMQNNEAPSDASWRSLSSRAQLAQDLWRQVQEELDNDEDSTDEDYQWLQEEVDEACLRAHEFARQRFQQQEAAEEAHPDLIQKIFFETPNMESPLIKDRKTRVGSTDDVMDPELGGWSEGPQQPSETEPSLTLSPLIEPVLTMMTPEKNTWQREELQKAQREQLEEAIAQMASQMKYETRRIHENLRGQTKELGTMEDLATQNVQKVGQVADHVKTHVQKSWRRTFATWTMLLTILGTFVLVMMTIQILPKRKNACLFFGCEPYQSQRPPVESVVRPAVERMAKRSYEEHVVHGNQDEKACEMTPEGECRTVIFKGGHNGNHKGRRQITREEMKQGDESQHDLHPLSTDESKHQDGDIHNVDEHLECSHQNLLYSAYDGDLIRLQYCLSLHPEWINQKDENGWTAIHEATNAGLSEIVEYLLHAGASVHSVNNVGQTPYEMALDKFGDDHEVTKFLQYHHHQSQEGGEGDAPQDHAHDEESSHHDEHWDHHVAHEWESSHHDTALDRHTLQEHHESHQEKSSHRDENLDHHVERKVTHDIHDEKKDHIETSDKEINIVKLSQSAAPEPSSDSNHVHSHHGDEPSPAATEELQIINCSPKHFQWVANSGDLDQVKRCLDLHPELIHQTDSQGWTCLHEAARAGRTHVLEYLLQKGADIYALTNHGELALDLAMHGHGEGHDVTKLLLQAKQHKSAEVATLAEDAPRHLAHDVATQDTTTGTNIHQEAQTSEDVMHVQEGGASGSDPPSVCTPTQFQFTASSGDLEYLKRCAALHPEWVNQVDEHGWTALHEAARSGHSDVVAFLLQHGANVEAKTKQGNLPITMAIQFHGQEHAVTKLLEVQQHSRQQHQDESHSTTLPDEHRDDGNQHGCVAENFQFLAKSGHFTELKRCLSLHPDWVNRADQHGWTALHEAAMAGQNDIVQHLLMSGAKVDARTNTGLSAMELSIKFLGEENAVAQIIQDYQAKYSNNNNNSNGPLPPPTGECSLTQFLFLSSAGQLDRVKSCVAMYPVLVNQADENGWTAIHEASRQGHVQLMQYLLNVGANVDVLTKSRLSSLDLARQFFGEDHPAIQLLLSVWPTHHHHH